MIECALFEGFAAEKEKDETCQRIPVSGLVVGEGLVGALRSESHDAHHNGGFNTQVTLSQVSIGS